MASITQRSLIRFGKGIAITLPKGWTDYYGLKPGDKVKVKVNSRLIVSIVRRERESGGNGLQILASGSLNQTTVESAGQKFIDSTTDLSENRY